MNAKHLLWGLTAASLLAPASVGAVRTDDAQHEQHGGNNSGPLPAAVRRATERFQNIDEAIAAGYVQSGGCVSGPQEGAMPLPERKR